MVVNDETPLDLFLKIGLDERTARNTVANNKVTSNLTAVIHEVQGFSFLRLIPFSHFGFRFSASKQNFGFWGCRLFITLYEKLKWHPIKVFIFIFLY